MASVEVKLPVRSAALSLALVPFPFSPHFPVLAFLLSQMSGTSG